eukprot:GEMP01118063.1.p1 GENE.GEMP01118063.1~~GEMP01118063.1.p1  ORF type:complete len:139 (+),score=14.38 GEMP01118063.1:92-508(+)
MKFIALTAFLGHVVVLSSCVDEDLSWPGWTCESLAREQPDQCNRDDVVEKCRKSCGKCGTTPSRTTASNPVPAFPKERDPASPPARSTCVEAPFEYSECGIRQLVPPDSWQRSRSPRYFLRLMTSNPVDIWTDNGANS